MMSTRLGGALLAVALPFAVTGVASASPDTSFTLTVAVPDGSTESVRLQCDPPDGTHPNAKRACAELHAVQGEFTELADNGQTMCTMEYHPMLAVAEGTWRGEPVSWEAEFSNSCVLRAETGTVFLF
jgi:hypothetical protein